MRHTKEPWSEEPPKRTHHGFDHVNIYSDGSLVAAVYGKANARRIVLCVNAHDSLIAQRDELLAALKYHQEQTRPIQRSIDAIANALEITLTELVAEAAAK